MKKIYGLFLCLAFLGTACSSDQASSARLEQPTPETNRYEVITTAYQQRREETPKLRTSSFWKWFKPVASADAKASAMYLAKKGLKADWKEALIIGASASLAAIFSGKSTTMAIQPSELPVLTDIQTIQEASFRANSMDDLGYLHYTLVNEVLQDSTLAALSPNERKGVLYDKVYHQAQKQNITTAYDKQEAIAVLTALETTVNDQSDAYYTTLFAFTNSKDFNDYKNIVKLYSSTFSKLYNPFVFTAYSKEMELAVVEDTTLSQTVKDVLLLEMATYRYGFTYYLKE